MEIRKKTWPDYFEAVLKGDKQFDARLGDFKAEVGDILVLEEWDPELKDYTGRVIKRRVSYRLHVPYTGTELWSETDLKQYGLQILSLEDSS